jgi:hypothetical protein
VIEKFQEIKTFIANTGQGERFVSAITGQVSLIPNSKGNNKCFYDFLASFFIFSCVLEAESI